jgi:hypothetical protein
VLLFVVRYLLVKGVDFLCVCAVGNDHWSGSQNRSWDIFLVLNIFYNGLLLLTLSLLRPGEGVDVERLCLDERVHLHYLVS